MVFFSFAHALYSTICLYCVRVQTNRFFAISSYLEKKAATFRIVKQNKRPHISFSSIENKHILQAFIMSSLSSSSSLGTGDIIGIVIGGVLALVTIIGIVISCYAMCCQKKKPPQVSPYPPPPNYQQNPYGQPMNTGYYPQQQYHQQGAYGPQQGVYGPQQGVYGPQQGQNWGPPPPGYAQQPHPYSSKHMN